MQSISTIPMKTNGLPQRNPRKLPVLESFGSQLVATSHLAPNQFVPLELEQRETVPTDVAAVHLNRAKQTLLVWATATYRDPPITPERINGRLHWSVPKIKRLVGFNANATA